MIPDTLQASRKLSCGGGPQPRGAPLPKITDLSVSFLSLVRNPATGKGLTLKSKPGERADTFEIVKTDDDRMVAYGVVYAPDQVDSHGDSADARTIRRAAYEFMREGRLKNIDTEHSFTAQMAHVAESWLVRKGDALFPDEPEGAWAVGIQINDTDLWQALKSGDLTGISLAGMARMDAPPTPPAPIDDPQWTEKGDQPPGWFSRWLNSLKSTPEKQPNEEKETPMDETKMREMVRAEVGDAVKEALKSAFGGKEDAPTDPVKAAEQRAEQAVAKALNGLDDKIAAQVAKAVAKGVTEAGDTQVKAVESFA